MAGSSLGQGDVFFFDLTTHTGVSKHTLKGPHFVAVVMDQQKLSNERHNTIVCVPLTSAHPQLMNPEKGRPRIFSHHLISADKYPELAHDTLIKCEQIFTINREFFSEYRFTLDAADLFEVRRRMVSVIGYDAQDAGPYQYNRKQTQTDISNGRFS